MKNNKELDKDRCWFVSPFGLGDTYLLCALSKAWEQKHFKKIGFIVKPSHKVVMDMFRIKNYRIAQFEDHELKKLAKKNPIPERGKIYVAHPAYIEAAQSGIAMLNSNRLCFKDLYTAFLGIPYDVELEEPKIIPKLSDGAKGVVDSLGGFEKLVLLCPEANSVKQVPKSFWYEIVEDYKNKGYTVLVNITKKENAISGAKNLKFAISDVVALACKCQIVISLRSGFCDLIAKVAPHLIVFYPTREDLFKYSLNKIFGLSIEEYVVGGQETTLSIEPKVTIVTPVFNIIKLGREKQLIRCVKSVAEQNYKNIEHILVDGDSKDGTVSFLERLQAQYKIRYISEPDSGIYDAMNKGTRYATGKYVNFLGSDDFIQDKKAVSTIVKKLEESDADFAYAPVRMTDDIKKNVQIFQPDVRLVLTGMPFSHQSMYVKRDVLCREPFDLKFKYAGDYDLILRLFLKNAKSVSVFVEAANYSMNGLSGSNYEDCIREYKQVYEKNYRNFVPKKYYDEMARYGRQPRQLVNLFKEKNPEVLQGMSKTFLVKLFGFRVLILEDFGNSIGLVVMGRTLVQISKGKFTHLTKRLIGIIGLKVVQH